MNFVMLKKKELYKSIVHAFRGLRNVYVAERNFRLQVFSALAALVLAVYLPLKTWELLLVILSAASVLVMEIINTVIEKLNDVLKPRVHPQVQVIKDITAGAVLLVSLTALLVGLIIFIPHIVNKF